MGDQFICLLQERLSSRDHARVRVALQESLLQLEKHRRQPARACCAVLGQASRGVCRPK
jgi:hypothetical protein